MFDFIEDLFSFAAEIIEDTASGICTVIEDVGSGCAYVLDDLSGVNKKQQQADKKIAKAKKQATQEVQQHFSRAEATYERKQAVQQKKQAKQKAILCHQELQLLVSQRNQIFNAIGGLKARKNSLKVQLNNHGYNPQALAEIRAVNSTLTPFYEQLQNVNAQINQLKTVQQQFDGQRYLSN